MCGAETHPRGQHPAPLNQETQSQRQRAAELERGCERRRAEHRSDTPETSPEQAEAELAAARSELERRREPLVNHPGGPNDCDISVRVPRFGVVMIAGGACYAG